MRAGSEPTTPFAQGRFEDLPERPRLAHRYFEGETATVLVASQPFGEIATHVVFYGPRDAPPLLLIHGLMTTSYSWRYMFERLGDRFRLVVPDLPGAGRSAVPAGRRPYTAGALATFVGELQEALGIAGCLTVGNSLGGYVCLRAALEDRARFARLAVIHPPALLEPRLVALRLGLAVPGAKAILATVVRHAPRRWAHRNVHYYDESLKSLEEAHEYGDPLASAAGAGAFIGYLADTLDPRELHAFGRELRRRRDRGASFPVALMAVYAEQDPTVPPKVGRRLQPLLPDAEWHWLDHTSHFVQVESPERLAVLLTEFLEPGERPITRTGAARSR
jgi:pimeloyl-ACP methyl ester carboxylesterase